MLEPVIFFFVSLARVGVWLSFNGLLVLSFSLFCVILEFDIVVTSKIDPSRSFKAYINYY